MQILSFVLNSQLGINTVGYPYLHHVTLNSKCDLTEHPQSSFPKITQNFYFYKHCIFGHLRKLPIFENFGFLSGSKFSKIQFFGYFMLESVIFGKKWKKIQFRFLVCTHLEFSGHMSGQTENWDNDVLTLFVTF